MLFSTEGMGLAPGHWIVPIANILENFIFLLTMILAVTLLVMGIIHLLIWKTLNDLELWSTASSLSPMDAMRGQRDKTALHKMAKGFENPHYWMLLYIIPTYVTMIAIGWTWTGTLGLAIVVGSFVSRFSALL